MGRHNHSIVCPPTSHACHLHNLHTTLGVASHEKVSCCCSAMDVPSSPPPSSSARGFGDGSERGGEKRSKKIYSQSHKLSPLTQKENKRTLALAFTCNRCNGRSTLMVRGLKHHYMCVLFKVCCETYAPSFMSVDRKGCI